MSDFCRALFNPASRESRPGIWWPQQRVFFGVPALQPEELLCLSRTDHRYTIAIKNIEHHRDINILYPIYKYSPFIFNMITHRYRYEYSFHRLDILTPSLGFFLQFPGKKRKRFWASTGSVTEAAAEKGKSQDVQDATESVFSGPPLPQAFYRSFLKAHSVKAVGLGGYICQAHTWVGIRLIVPLVFSLLQMS